MDYTQEAKNIVKDLFHEDWMNPKEWSKMEEIILNNITYEFLAQQIEEGIKNGYSLQFQKHVISKFLKNE